METCIGAKAVLKLIGGLDMSNITKVVTDIINNSTDEMWRYVYFLGFQMHAFHAILFFLAYLCTGLIVASDEKASKFLSYGKTLLMVCMLISLFQTVYYGAMCLAYFKG